MKWSVLENKSVNTLFTRCLKWPTQKAFKSNRLPIHVDWTWIGKTCLISWSEEIWKMFNSMNLEQKSVRGKPSSQTARLADQSQQWPKVLEHQTDLVENIHLLLISRTWFHAIKLMKSADGFSELNKCQMKSVLLFLPTSIFGLTFWSSYSISPLCLSASVFAKSFNINVALKGFSLNAEQIYLVDFPSYPSIYCIRSKSILSCHKFQCSSRFILSQVVLQKWPNQVNLMPKSTKTTES